MAAMEHFGTKVSFARRYSATHAPERAVLAVLVATSAHTERLLYCRCGSTWTHHEYRFGMFAINIYIYIYILRRTLFIPGRAAW